MLKVRGAFHPLTVSGVEPLTDDSAAVTFAVPEELRAEFDFAAGQSLTLRRTIDGVEHRRSYSICAPAGAAPRIGVREIPGGLFSRWLVHEVRPGDVIEVQTPTGSFAASDELPGRHLCIAAGSGITPMISIASTVLRHPESQVTLVYGNRRTTTVMFAEELADLKNTYRHRLDLVHVLSREPRDVELFSGRLDADRLRRLLTTLVPVGEWTTSGCAGRSGSSPTRAPCSPSWGCPGTACTSSCSTSTSRRRSCRVPRQSSPAT
ncbi:FAD-binding oxidoreductase [Nocardioides piscis]|uniref:FAD-binding oxidoreductase n=1 Tax=Nocardioides piscis TaxID=2714938 RepID=UPI001FE2D3EA|nr:FAD-binding oxidoreductase [Nocardioides piscis]